MSTERCNPHPIESDGTSWRQRALEALAPEDNPIDGRDLSDLLVYTERYASLLQYWKVGQDETDENRDIPVRDSDWQEFITQDVSALVARIGQEEIPALRRRFESLSVAVKSATAATLPALFGELYQEVADIAGRLDSWHRAAPEDLSLSRELEGWIASTLGEAMRTVVAQAERARMVDPRVPELDTSGLHDLWRLDNILPDVSLFSHGRLNHDDDKAKAVEQVAQAHGEFLGAVQQLMSEVPAFLLETLYDYPEHKPHMALLLAFLQLFGIARHHMNRLTGEHLKFYYNRVLGLDHGVAVADKAHLVLEPAKNLDSGSKIAKDTAFKAGKDATGVELIYASDEELILNQAQLDEDEGLKSIYVTMKQGEIKNIHAATDADSADGIGADLENEEGRWQTFGGEEMPYAELGFAVASPMLLLGEGERTIEVRFDLDARLAFPADVSESDVAKELRLNIIAQGSGEKGWVDLDIHKVQFEDDQGPCLKFRLQLGAMEPALTAYNSDVLNGSFDTKHPLLRFVLDNEGLPAADRQETAFIPEDPEPPCEPHIIASPGGIMGKWRGVKRKQLLPFRRGIINFEDSISYFAPGVLVRFGGKLYRSTQAIEQPGFRPGSFQTQWMPQRISYPYRYLQGMEVRGLRIDVRVREMRNLILENDQGILNPAKPFMPFGPVPKMGSAFLIGSSEVFSKQLDEVRLEVSWANLPTESFSQHYMEYGITALTSNQYFTATSGILQDGTWGGGTSVALFDDAGGDGNPPAAQRCFELKDDSLLARNQDLGDFKQYRAGMRQGFMQFRLDSKDFAHTLYPVKLAEAAINKPPVTMPNVPYVPLISELNLSYKAHEEIEFRGEGADDFAGRIEQLFQIWPFGRREIWPIADVDDPGEVPVERRLLPHFEVTGDSGAAQTAEGTLYVGFKELDLSAGSKNLSVLVQVAEGSADPELPVQAVTWSYLVDDVWHDFKASEILADDTNGFLRSGIIRFAMPKRMTDKNQTLQTGWHWIKVSVVHNSNAVCRLIAIHAQAVTVSLRDQDNDPDHLTTPMAAGSISKLKERMAAIKKVEQPYASFGGRVAEGDDDFYVRVSERLRHKGRAITLFDYERLVLEAFPEIYKVKCINHANRQQEHVPGSVWVIVVPDLRNRNAVDPLKPRASLDTLDRIQDYLTDLASDFINLDVGNPDYEEIRVQFQVRFHNGYDQGYYLGQLVTDIQNYLSPWLHDEAADISFGGRIHRSKVLQFVEQCEYVDFITDFRMDQQVAGAWCLDVDEAVASNAGAVLVSARTGEYQIGVNVNSCEDEEVVKAAEEEEKEAVLSGPRFLGNTGSRELHDLNNLTPLCHTDRIDMDRQRRFYSITDARGMGYDLCAHCFGRDRSKR